MIRFKRSVNAVTRTTKTRKIYFSRNLIHLSVSSACNPCNRPFVKMSNSALCFQVGKKKNRIIYFFFKTDCFYGSISGVAREGTEGTIILIINFEIFLNLKGK